MFPLCWCCLWYKGEILNPWINTCDDETKNFLHGGSSYVMCWNGAQTTWVGVVSWLRSYTIARPSTSTADNNVACVKAQCKRTGGECAAVPVGANMSNGTAHHIIQDVLGIANCWQDGCPGPQGNSKCTMLWHNTVTPKGSHPEKKAWLAHGESNPSPWQQSLTTQLLKLFIGSVLHIHCTAQTLHIATSNSLDHQSSTSKQNMIDVMMRRKPKYVNTWKQVMYHWDKCSSKCSKVWGVCPLFLLFQMSMLKQQTKMTVTHPQMLPTEHPSWYHISCNIFISTSLFYSQQSLLIISPKY
jgi:hypothetical protein